mmetsp:Transcript_56554/g.132662  ORF Transcript_56554/g.132662 Transcript_56554/m.132662 type:complete len:225 (-) Transcript_56554:24-698(-)
MRHHAFHHSGSFRAGGSVALRSHLPGRHPLSIPRGSSSHKGNRFRDAFHQRLLEHRARAEEEEAAAEGPDLVLTLVPNTDDGGTFSSVSCLSLAGTSLLELDVEDTTSRVENFRRRVAKEMKVPTTRLKLLLPGQTDLIMEEQDPTYLRDLFGFSQQPDLPGEVAEAPVLVSESTPVAPVHADAEVPLRVLSHRFEGSRRAPRRERVWSLERTRSLGRSNCLTQ